MNKKITVFDKNFIFNPESGVFYDTTKNAPDDYYYELSEQSFYEGIKYLSIHVAHDCNMKCLYCYGNGGDYYSGKSKYLDEDTMEEIINFFKKYAVNSDVYLNFFGGEPMLAIEMVEKAIHYAENVLTEEGRSIFYSLSTSGTILNDRITKLIKDYQINLSLSIDGELTVHDSLRMFNSGKGTFERIKENSATFQDLQDNILITSTVTSKNLNIKKSAQEIYNLGYRNMRFKLVTGDVGVLKLKEEHVRKLKMYYNELAIQYLSDLLAGKVYDIGDFTKYIDRLQKRQKVLVNCDAGRNYLNISPDGGVFICHKFVSVTDTCMCNIKESFVPINGNEFHVDKTNCNVCWAKYLCGGGCFYDSYVEDGILNNTANKLKCKVIKHQIILSMYIYNVLSESNNLDIISKIYKSKSNYETVV